MSPPIEEYEVHPFYPTRFFRWATFRTTYNDQVTASVITIGYSPDRKLQQKWRNISGAEEWREIPEELVDPTGGMIRPVTINVDPTSI